MNTSHNKYDAIETLIFKEGLKIRSIEFDSNHTKMLVHLTNEATLIVPVSNYKNLIGGSFDQLENFKLIGSGTGIHWPELDEDLSLKGFLNELLRQLVKQKDDLVLA